MYFISERDFVWVLFGLTACWKSCPFNLLRLTPSGRNTLIHLLYHSTEQLISFHMNLSLFAYGELQIHDHMQSKKM